MNIITWLREKGVKWHSWTCPNAASGGHLPVLQYIRSHGCPWDDYTTYLAASNGYLHILKWAIENGCEVGVNSFSSAASNGHIPILSYLHSLDPIKFKFTPEICSQSAEGGHIDSLRWIQSTGCEWDKNTILKASTSSYSENTLEIVQYSIENGCPCPNQEEFEKNRRYIPLDVIQYLEDKGLMKRRNE